LFSGIASGVENVANGAVLNAEAAGRPVRRAAGRTDRPAPTTSGRDNVPSRFTARLLACAGSALAVGSLAACSSSSSGASGSASSNPLSAPVATGTIVVGSDNFPESVLLGDIYGQALAAKGYKVSYKPNIGTREVTYNLLKSGGITLKPEYNGALLAYLDTLSHKAAEPQTSTAQVDAAVAADLPSNLEILDPAAAQDNDTLTLTANEATKLGLAPGATISDFIKALGSQTVSIGASSEFQTRQQGLLGLEGQYGLKASQVSYTTLDAGGPLTEAALAHGTVEAGDLFTTDTTISADHLLTLVDDKDVFGLQNVVPLLQKSALPAAGVAALNAVDAKLDSKTLLSLDVLVEADKQDPATVATTWLKQAGLV
jgi:osmoprotectant transport system substrate-binding protein